MIIANRDKVLLLIALTAAIGCSTIPKETPKGKAIVVVKGPITESCTQVGKIRYDGTPFIHDKELLIIMKENAAKLGGNAIRLDTFTPGVTGVSNAKGLGTSYKCPSSKLKSYKNNSENQDSSSDEVIDEESVDSATETSSPRTKTKSKTKRAKGAGSNRP